MSVFEHYKNIVTFARTKPQIAGGFSTGDDRNVCSNCRRESTVITYVNSLRPEPAQEPEPKNRHERRAAAAQARRR